MQMGHKKFARNALLLLINLDVQFIQQPFAFHVSNAELSWKLVHFCWLVDLRQDFTIWPRLSLNLRSQTCATMPGLNCCSVESGLFQSEISLSEINEIGLSSWMQILKGKKWWRFSCCKI